MDFLVWNSMETWISNRAWIPYGFSHTGEEPIQANRLAVRSASPPLPTLADFMPAERPGARPVPRGTGAAAVVPYVVAGQGKLEIRKVGLGLEGAEPLVAPAIFDRCAERSFICQRAAEAAGLPIAPTTVTAVALGQTPIPDDTIVGQVDRVRLRVGLRVVMDSLIVYASPPGADYDLIVGKGALDAAGVTEAQRTHDGLAVQPTSDYEPDQDGKPRVTVELDYAGTAGAAPSRVLDDAADRVAEHCAKEIAAMKNMPADSFILSDLIADGVSRRRRRRDDGGKERGAKTTGSASGRRRACAPPSLFLQDFPLPLFLHGQRSGQEVFQHRDRARRRQGRARLGLGP